MSRRDSDGDVAMSERADGDHRTSNHERNDGQVGAGTSTEAQPAVPLFKLLSKRKYKLHLVFCLVHG